MSEIKATGPAGCAALVLLAPLTIYHGLLFSKLWGWFAAPMFHAPVMNVPQAIGLVAILRFLKGYDSHETLKSEDATDQVLELLRPTIYVTLLFAIGYVAHLYT